MNTINNRRPPFKQSRMCTECPPKPPKNTEEILKKSTKTIKKATKHKKSIGCFPALLTALAISGAVIGGIQYNNKQKNSAEFPIPATNVQNTEMTTILPVKDGGTVYFFSMATSFTKSALGAEGVGKDVNMIIGNGYTKGHANTTLNDLREHEGIRKLFETTYA